MNQTERYDELHRRGKVIMDVLDEVVKEAKPHVTFDKAGRACADMDRLIEVELGRAAGDESQRAEHERLRDAVLEAVKIWANNDKGFTRINLRQRVFELWDFERGMKEKS